MAKTLAATFSLPRRTLELFIELETARSHSTLNITLDNRHGVYTTAEGHAQDVMFLIAEVAAQGFDNLEWVRGPNSAQKP